MSIANGRHARAVKKVEVVSGNGVSLPNGQQKRVQNLEMKIEENACIS
jgi:hypothetical protein